MGNALSEETQQEEMMSSYAYTITMAGLVDVAVNRKTSEVLEIHVTGKVCRLTRCMVQQSVPIHALLIQLQLLGHQQALGV